MSDTSPLAGRTALVTGASGGLGADIAHALAARGADLVLVARRSDRLAEVAAAIETAHGVRATTVTADLADPQTPAALHQTLSAQHRIDILVNNAGFGIYGDEIDIPWERTQQMLQVDIVALTHLTKLFARDMKARGWGRILQVASIGAFQPSPSYAAYAAAKAYVLHFGEALDFELRGSGVSCTVVSPGVTATEFLQVSGQRKNWFHRLTMLSSESVSEQAVRAMLRGRRSIVTGWINRIMIFSVRFTPRRLMAWAGHVLMRN